MNTKIKCNPHYMCHPIYFQYPYFSTFDYANKKTNRLTNSHYFNQAASTLCNIFQHTFILTPFTTWVKWRNYTIRKIRKCQWDSSMSFMLISACEDKDATAPLLYHYFFCNVPVYKNISPHIKSHHSVRILYEYKACSTQIYQIYCINILNSIGTIGTWNRWLLPKHLYCHIFTVYCIILSTNYLQHLDVCYLKEKKM